MASGVWQIPKIPELRNRLLVMILLLGVYRIGVFIPNPGVDRTALQNFFQSAGNTLFGMYDMFAGGALEQFSIFTLGIMPYISASIIIQLLAVAVPALERLQKEGEAGRQKITQYTRYGTIALSIIQGTAIAFGLESMRAPGGEPVVIDPGWDFRAMSVLSLTTGTCFIMWLGERITDRGIGNGISLIIMAGIVARLPAARGRPARRGVGWGGSRTWLTLSACTRSLGFQLANTAGGTPLLDELPPPPPLRLSRSRSSRRLSSYLSRSSLRLSSYPSPLLLSS